jgi:nucleoside-diphosphate-sugar epimerase
MVSSGRPVRCLVRRSSATSGLAGAGLAYGDLVSGEGLEAALQGVECVLHLAGVTKALRPEDYFIGNGRATANLVRAMEGGTARLVHVSSLAAAGPSQDGQPLDEDAPPSPVSFYGKSKLEAERVARARQGSVVVRPPVVYGPRDRDVFQVLRSVSRGLVLEIAGGERWFSAIYVQDLVRGLLAAADSPRAAGRVYFLTSPQPHTWGELASTAAAIMGKRPRVVRLPYAAARAAGFAAEMWSLARGKPGILSRDKIAEARCAHWTCRGDRASREIGFTADTGLREGLALTLEWYREQGWLSW